MKTVEEGRDQIMQSLTGYDGAFDFIPSGKVLTGFRYDPRDVRSSRAGIIFFTFWHQVTPTWLAPNSNSRSFYPTFTHHGPGTVLRV